MARGAVRSMHGMAAVLAHEIKNPLAGIRGAAQLLEEALPPDEREMTQLICDGSRPHPRLDRPHGSFGDTRSFPRHPVNIHEVLDRVRKVAETELRARRRPFVENFDPSLPPVAGDRDQLIQVFLNLVRNAADALPETGGEITLTTGYRPGVQFRRRRWRASACRLPLEVTVRDNGSGVPADLMPLHLRSLRHHQGARLGPGPGAGRQDRRRPWRRDRMRLRSAAAPSSGCCCPIAASEEE